MMRKAVPVIEMPVTIPGPLPLLVKVKAACAVVLIGVAGKTMDPPVAKLPRFGPVAGDSLGQSWGPCLVAIEGSCSM